MSPTLNAGDRVLIVRHLPPRTWLRKGQIVVLSRSDAATRKQALFGSKLSIKRIVGLGGETITTAPLISQRAQHRTSADLAMRVWSIPPGQVFVCGDNHANSIDSTTWGPVPASQIVGVVITKLPYKATSPSSPGQHYGPAAGHVAPAFTALTLSGETVTLATYHAHPLLLIFFMASPSCLYALTRCMDLARKASEAGTTVLLVSDRGVEDTQAFMTELTTDLSILTAPRRSNSLLADYHMHVFPAYCFINEQGKILSTGLIDKGERVWQTVLDSQVAPTSSL